MSLSHEHSTALNAPEHPPLCCTQQTITIPPAVNAKTAQKHDWPSASHRASYARRTAAERTFSRLHDPTATDISRGWSRLMGLTPNAIMLACATITAPKREDLPIGAIGRGRLCDAGSARAWAGSWAGCLGATLLASCLPSPMASSLGEQ